MKNQTKIGQALKTLLARQDTDAINEVFTQTMCEEGQRAQVDLAPDPRHHCDGIVRIHNKEGQLTKVCKFVVSADTTFCSNSPDGKASLPGEHQN